MDLPIMWHVVIQLLFLAAAGPLAGLVIARLTGPMTWRRALVGATICQLVVIAGYLATHGVPLVIYGDERPRPIDFLLARAQLAAFLLVVGVVVAAALTPVVRWASRP